MQSAYMDVLIIVLKHIWISNQLPADGFSKIVTVA